MATLITKNSSTASAVPAVGDLVKGELAVNVTDKKVYTKDNSAAVVKLVGSLGNQEANAVAITGGTINGTSIGATTTSTGAFTTVSASSGFTGNLTGNVTGNVSGTAANVTGIVAIANGGTGLSALGTGVQSALGQNVTGSGSFVLSTSPSLTTPNLGTPSAVVLTNATGLPLTTGVTGTLGIANGGTGITAFGTGVATALGQNVTGSGGIVLATSPSLTTPNLGTPSAATLTNATGLPISTGVSGLGTGVATALAVNTGSAGAFVVNGGALGTPSSGTVTNLTGTASININGTVGATTPTTGAFTTLSASGNITVSGGTANGVAYLNGSKVLTSGSALSFDGTNLSVGGSNSQQRLNVVVPVFTTNASGGVRIGDSGNNYFVDQLVTTDGSANPFWDIKFATHTLSRYAYGGGNNFWAWYANNTEAMRLTSTSLYTASGINVGIGTSSPDTKLTLAGSGHLLSLTNPSSSIANGIIRWKNSSGTTQAFIGSYVNVADTGNLEFGNGSTTTLNLTASGNLGLGVTPSAWDTSYYKALEGGDGNNQGAVAFRTDTNGVELYANGYFNGTNNIYKHNGAAGLYQNTTGQHKWFTAPSGTAGNAISFTQAMTLDASGNFYIGTTSQIGGARVNFYQPNSSTDMKVGVGVATATNAAYMSFVNNATTTIGTENSSGGGLVIGSSAYSTVINNTGAYPISFGTNNTERARITSGGYFKASDNGTYLNSTGTFHELRNSVNEASVAITNTNASLTSSVVYVGTTIAAGTGFAFFKAFANNIEQCQIRGDGNIYNTNGTYGTLSDQKLKQDIVDAGSQWDDIKAIRFRKYRMKTDVVTNYDAPILLGVVAQELEQTSPGLVDEHTDRDAEGNDLGTTTKSVKTSILLMKAAVALQEAMARIEQLESKVAQLEAK